MDIEVFYYPNHDPEVGYRFWAWVLGYRPAVLGIFKQLLSGPFRTTEDQGLGRWFLYYNTAPTIQGTQKGAIVDWVDLLVTGRGSAF